MITAMWRHAAILLAMSTALQGQARSSLVGVSASPQKVLLVELFTSEGCSSCPPADALLRKINGSRPAPGELIVGVSEHVTYWNSLGWRDPFSDSTYTDRQNVYGTRFGLDSVYTPQMVVNGAEQFVGSDRASLAAAIEKEHNIPSPVAVHILSAEVEGGALKVRFSAVGPTAANGADIVAVVAEDFVRSNVSRGENSGRTLAHVAVALSLRRVAQLQPAAQQEVLIALPPSGPTNGGRHLILFAQAEHSGRVLGADAKPL